MIADSFKISPSINTGYKRHYDNISEVSSADTIMSAKKICLDRDNSNTNLSEYSIKDKKSSSSEFNNPRRWNTEEDERLLQAVKLFGEIDWKLNSDFVGTRDNGKTIIIHLHNYTIFFILFLLFFHDMVSNFDDVCKLHIKFSTMILWLT